MRGLFVLLAACGGSSVEPDAPAPLTLKQLPARLEITAAPQLAGAWELRFVGTITLAGQPVHPEGLEVGLHFRGVSVVAQAIEVPATDPEPRRLDYQARLSGIPEVLADEVVGVSLTLDGVVARSEVAIPPPFTVGTVAPVGNLLEVTWSPVASDRMRGTEYTRNAMANHNACPPRRDLGLTADTGQLAFMPVYSAFGFACTGRDVLYRERDGVIAPELAFGSTIEAAQERIAHAWP